jgi:hypothetical protein
VNNNTATGAGDGSTFYEEPGDRGPMTFPEILSAHKALKMAIAGFVERPRGVSQGRWDATLELAERVTPGFCWILGHLDGPLGRSLDMVVRAAGPIAGGMPDPGPIVFPSMYLSVIPPFGACPQCGVRHPKELPHDYTPIYQQYFFCVNGRRPTLEDTCAHCVEPVQIIYAEFWSKLVPWPNVPPGFQPPEWFA